MNIVIDNIVAGTITDNIDTITGTAGQLPLRLKCSCMVHACIHLSPIVYSIYHSVYILLSYACMSLGWNVPQVVFAHNPLGWIPVHSESVVKDLHLLNQFSTISSTLFIISISQRTLNQVDVH